MLSSSFKLLSILAAGSVVAAKATSSSSPPFSPISNSTNSTNSLSYKGLNVTVDDTYGDFINGVVPNYAPADLWVQGSDCSQCDLQPNLAWTIGGTWKETSYYGGPEGRNITFEFAGIGVYAYFIVPNSVQGNATVNTNMTFVLDGEPAGYLTHTPTNKSVVPFLYNQLGFSASDLENTTHTLEVHAGAPENGSSVVLFDHLVYTIALSNNSDTPLVTNVNNTSTNSTA